MTCSGTTESHTCGSTSVDSDADRASVNPSHQNRRQKSIALLSGAAKHSGTVSLADQMVASATNFLTGIIIARSCTKEEFGLYMLGFTIILFVHELQTSLISAPYMVYSQRLTGREHAWYMGSSLIHQLQFSILVIVVLAAGALATSEGLGFGELTPVICALILVVFFIMLREFIRRICFAGLVMATAFLVDCTVAAVQLTSLLLLAYLGVLSAPAAFFCIGLACGITSLGWLFFKRHSFSFHRHHILSDFRKNLSFGKWTFASSLLWALSMTLYPWLLVFFHGTASAGVWAACWGIIAIANPLLLGIQNFLGPKVVQSYTSGGALALRRFVVRVSGIYLLIITPLAIGLFIFGGRLVVLFYGEKYAGNGLVVSILAINLLVMAASFTLSRALLAIEKAKVYFMANIIPLIIILTLGVFLVKKLGPTGVAWGLLIGTATTAAMMSFLFSGLMKTACTMEATNE